MSVPPALSAPVKDLPASPASPDSAVIRFVVELASALHRYGTTAHRLENALHLVSRRLGLEAQFFSTPTAVFVSILAPGEPRTILLRVEPGDLDLEKLAALDAVASELMRGEIELAAASERVAAVKSAPDRYPPWLSVAAYALSSATAARFFGGGWREVIAAAVIGGSIGVLGRLAHGRQAAIRVFDPTAATLAALFAGLGAAWWPPLAALTVIVAGLITLLPGLSLTLAMSELATRDLASGSARLAGTVLAFLTLTFGVALGSQLAWLATGQLPPAAVATPLPGWTEWLALAVAPLALVVSFRAHPRDIPGIVASGAVAYLGVRLGAVALGTQLGAFAGAVAVGAGSNLYSRWFDRPSAITLVPGILFLVPGSIGFRSFNSLLESDIVSGVGTAFQMTLVAISLVTGLLVANVLVPPRKAL